MEKITQLCYRFTYVEGSTTLITRCGLLSWIRSGIELHSRDSAQRFLLQSLALRVYRTCDKTRIDEWTGQGGSNASDVFRSLGIGLPDGP